MSHLLSIEDAVDDLAVLLQKAGRAVGMILYHGRIRI